MSIATEITALTGDRNDIRTALAAKGVTASGHGFDDFAADIISLPSGGITVNQNLLDNWYFPNAVNQRGKTTYSASSYTKICDRWDTDRSTVTLSSSGITLQKTSGQIDCYVGQYLNPAVVCIGETLTASALLKSNVGDSFVLHSETFQFPAINHNYIPDFGTEDKKFELQNPHYYPTPWFGLYITGSQYIIAAIKLERGSQQTLAHQENGIWVLNETPSQNEMMGECLRYFRKFSTSYWTFLSSTQKPPTSAAAYTPNLRTTGAVSTMTIGGATHYVVNADF